MTRIQSPSLTVTGSSRSGSRSLCCLILFVLATVNGCAALTNPVADGIPVRRLPNEALGESRELLTQIPLTSLRQPPPEVYKLGPGDVLGVWVEGVLGDRNTPPPVRIPERGDQPISVGYPTPVRENGTIALPLIDPVKVEGLSIEQAQAEITKAYTIKKKIIQPGRERVIVTLTQPRRYHILVMREDSGTISFGATGGTTGLNGGTFVSETRRSKGFPIELPAYENDVLNALTQTGGFPGAETENEIIIQRGGSPASDTGNAPNLMPSVTANSPSSKPDSSAQTIRIPLRLKPGEKPTFKPSDIILKSGDIVYVKLRKGDIFYTGGLLPPRAFPLPPGKDLNVIEAIALVGGPILNGGLGSNNLSGSIQSIGLGSPSPSSLVVLRKTCNGGQIPIKVSLNLAFRDPRERILVQPGDILVLQETMSETITRYITQTFRFNFFGTIIRQQDLTGTTGYSGP